jgi:hypothetical protein
MILHTDRRERERKRLGFYPVLLAVLLACSHLEIELTFRDCERPKRERGEILPLQRDSTREGAASSPDQEPLEEEEASTPDNMMGRPALKKGPRTPEDKRVMEREQVP